MTSSCSNSEKVHNSQLFDRFKHRCWPGEVALESLRARYEEVGRREARLADLGAKKVTRALAEKYPDLRPVVALFSECHELFGHGEHGKEAADLAVQTMRRARKTAISLAFDTQSSRADAIPPKIVELVKINACFAVKSWRSNDGFLGDGSFQAGIRATELRMGKDVGTSVLTGATDERFEIVKWFYIEVDDDTGYDAAADIIGAEMAAVPAADRDTAAAVARTGARHQGSVDRQPVPDRPGCGPRPARGAGDTRSGLGSKQRRASRLRAQFGSARGCTGDLTPWLSAVQSLDRARGWRVTNLTRHPRPNRGQNDPARPM